MKIIEVQSSDLQKIEGDRSRTFTAIESSLSADLILQDIREHNRRRVIVLCNVVSLSQGLFHDLNNHPDSNGLEVTLLHSRFLPEDRKEKEADLERRFGKEWQKHDDGKCHVLISTQVIEVGINITCEVMHTHLSPMSSLLQRAGRCARFGGRGEVRVYREIQVGDDVPALTEADIAEDVDDQGKQTSRKRQFLPYEDEICNLTWDVLQEHDVSLSVGFEVETQWVNKVHQRESELQIKRRQNNRKNFLTQFENATFRGDRSASRELIRWVDNRNIFVTEEQICIDGESTEVPIDHLEPFSLPVTTLCKAYRDFRDAGHQTWLFKRIESPSKDQAETYSQPICTEINSQKDIITSIRLLVNPDFVFYNEEIGLRITSDPELENPSDRFSSRSRQNKSVINQYQYHMDTYEGHLGFMWKCWREAFSEFAGEKRTFASVREEMNEAGGRFVQSKIFPETSSEAATALFEILVFLSIVIHDLGKLQAKWQSVMGGWQAIAYQQFGQKNAANQLLAHTDYDPSNKAMKLAYDDYMKKNQRPPHAIESAFLGWEFLEFCLWPVLESVFEAGEEQMEKLTCVVLMAAGRHHSAWARGWKAEDIVEKQSITLHPGTNQAIAKSWSGLLKSLNSLLSSSITLPPEPFQFEQTTYEVEEVQLACFEPYELEYQQLYALVARALRLCDSRSVQINHL